MATIRPFKAVHPRPDKVQDVASLPYDVMSREEAREMAAGNPLSFLHITRSEIDLPENAGPYDEAVYKKAKENYDKLKTQSSLQQDESPALYIYSLTWRGHTQTGIVATASVDDYDNDIIKKHEKTRQVKEDDRTNHIVTTRAQTGPVFLTYRDDQTIADIILKVKQDEPMFDFTAEDGVTHKAWKVSEQETVKLIDAFGEIPALYIADGHHRAASASRARQELREREGGDEEAAFDYFLAVIFPAGDLQILPYNRSIKDLNGHTPDSLLEAVKEDFDVEQTSETAPSQPLNFYMYLPGQWWKLSYRHSIEGLSPAERLDVAILQNTVLQPLLGIGNPRTDERIDFIGGIRGTEELERVVDSGEAAVAFSLYPTTVDQLIAISDAGEIMPPKSTWFEPKLRDGLFVHEV
ncbi:MAG: DUF1015 domain-containing protein [Lentisphaeria bacterium]